MNLILTKDRFKPDKYNAIGELQKKIKILEAELHASKVRAHSP